MQAHFDWSLWIPHTIHVWVSLTTEKSTKSIGVVEVHEAFKMLYANKLSAEETADYLAQSLIMEKSEQSLKWQDGSDVTVESQSQLNEEETRQHNCCVKGTSFDMTLELQSLMRMTEVVRNWINCEKLMTCKWLKKTPAKKHTSSKLTYLNKAWTNSYLWCWENFTENFLRYFFWSQKMLEKVAPEVGNQENFKKCSSLLKFLFLNYKMCCNLHYSKMSTEICYKKYNSSCTACFHKLLFSFKKINAWLGSSYCTCTSSWLWSILSLFRWILRLHSNEASLVRPIRISLNRPWFSTLHGESINAFLS